MASTNVVVWEYMDCYNAMWVLFEPVQCNTIEKAYQKYKTSLTGRNVVSGHNHSVDFELMEETDSRTNDVSPVRRLVFPSSSALANQVLWKWNVTSNHKPFWQPYPADVIDYIERKFTKKKYKSLDLSKKFPELNYTVDFSKKLQINNISKYSRSIKRILIPDNYPNDTCINSSPSLSAYTSSANLPSNGATSSQNSGVSASINLLIPDDLKQYAMAVPSPSSDSCSICLCSFQESSYFSQVQQGSLSAYATVVMLKKCKHVYHTDCLKASIKSDAAKGSLVCPTCKTIYGVKIGCQPPGSMTHRTVPQSLPGHPSCGTIIITYNFRSGVQTAEHPNPGQPYRASSFPRHAYLPDCNEGKKILSLLKIAFDRRLTFTIGRSVTTGMDNVITWNEIHHKTEMGTNYGHGYPDPNYFVNVLAELKQHGVTEDDLKP